MKIKKRIMVLAVAIALVLLMIGTFYFAKIWRQGIVRRELIEAIRSGDSNLLDELLSNGASADTYLWRTNHHRKNLVMLAAEEGNLEAVKRLHAGGANVYETSWGGDNLLIIIMSQESQKSGHYDCFQFLVKLPRLADMASPSGYTPLHFSIIFNLPIEYVQSLISNGAKVNQNLEGLGPPLFLLSSDRPQPVAVEQQKLDIARLLLESGADVNWVSPEGLTATSVAKSKKRMALFSILRENGGKLSEELANTIIDRQPNRYRCSLHPQQTSPESGKCPTCGLDFVPVASKKRRSISNVEGDDGAK